MSESSELITEGNITIVVDGINYSHIWHTEPDDYGNKMIVNNYYVGGTEVNRGEWHRAKNRALRKVQANG